MRDVKLTNTGDFPHYVGDLITGHDLVVQRTAIRFRTFRGGWLLDAAQGFPFVQWSGRKTAARAVVLAAKREAEGVPGVKRAEVTGALDAATRRTAVNVAIVFDDGTRRGLTFAPFGAFGEPLPTVVSVPS